MTAQTLPRQLPALREDLQLHPAAPHNDGSPAWVIQDPVSNGFYRIGWLEFELLSRWSLGNANAILEAVAKETLLSPSSDELAALCDFLMQSQLLNLHDRRHTEGFIARHKTAKGGRMKWLLHHYLFFRVPIVHPTRALQTMLPWVSWVFTRGTAYAVIGLSLLGLMLTARQWDVFIASFVDTLSPSGFASYMVALALTKSLHELGHAFTATRYGLRVAHMGVAFLVMWPVLYTDTGESWRLSDSKKRLRIAAAGIVTELAIAGLATLAWNLCGDGDIKQALFFLGSTAWLISLGLNISPFMRFDGYFIVSDWLDMPNLHERSFALARVALRNTLLGWQEPEPEPIAPAKRRLLIAFAFGTWMYRLVVFAGIAVAVYFYFFKLLGIFLFAVEITWFIALPMWREIRVWLNHKSEIMTNRKILGVLGLAVLSIALLVPWRGQIHGFGIAHPAQTHTFYSPGGARVLAKPAPGKISEGQPVFLLEQPEFDYRAKVAELSVQVVDTQLRSLSGIAEGEDLRSRMETQRAMHLAEEQAQREEGIRLTLKAPFSGVLSDVDPELAPGVWINGRRPLATLVDPSKWEAEALITQDALARVKRGAQVRFYPERDRLSPLTGNVSDVETTRVTQLPNAMLSSRNGGTVPVLQDNQGLSPRDVLYRVRIRLSNAPSDLKVLRGSAVIDGDPQSLVAGALKPALIVLIRELGF